MAAPKYASWSHQSGRHQRQGMFAPGRLHLISHVYAPVADFPVRRVIGAHHFLADLTLPYGRVVYNKQDENLAESAE
jgi:acetoacetate decarboxylase